MKKILLLILGASVGSAACQAQDGQPAAFDEGWFATTNAVSSVSMDPNGAHPLIGNPAVPGGTSAIAEASTTEISALARGLQNDPKRIFDFVHDHIRYVHYFGSHKGAELTLLERSGNDFDQCSLLVALLRAAGLTATYQFGLVDVQYAASNQEDYQHFFGTTLTSTDWTNAVEPLIININGKRGFPVCAFLPGDTNDVVFHHVWVHLVFNGTDYYLDPSFKLNQSVSGINLDTAMSMNTNTLLSVAGGTTNADYVQGLNEAALRSALQTNTTTLVNYLQNTYPNASVTQIVGGQQIVSSMPTSFGSSLFVTNFSNGGTIPVSEWTYIPTSLMAVLTVGLPGTNVSFFTPALEGQPLSLTFSSNGLAQLWLQTNQVSSISTSSSSNTVNVTLSIQHPYGNGNSWNFSSTSPLQRVTSADQSATTGYQWTNSSYILLYAFDISPQWLTERQQQLENYRAQGLPDTSQAVQTETLNVMGLNWLVQTEMRKQLMTGQTSILPHWQHRLGRMGQETGRGYYIDVYAQVTGDVPGAGVTNTASVTAFNQLFQGGGYFDSAFEHGIIEQLQNSNLTAASTVKLLQLANTNGQRIYLATSTNWSSGASVSTHLTNYNVTDLFNRYIASNYSLLLPSNGAVQIAGTGTWKGSGYVALQIIPNGIQQQGMIIGGGYNGGYVSAPGAIPNPPIVFTLSSSQSTYYDPASATAPIQIPNIGDPVNPVDATFRVQHTDLALGQTEPRGLSFTRLYSSSRRNANPAGMANGWLHNYYATATVVSAPEQSLGTTTPAQMAAMLVATRAALDIYNPSQPDPKNWLVTALIAKWGIDQLLNKSVSINLGEDTVQFIQQPDGTFTPPANCTMTLAVTNGAYTLQERHGNQFRFNTNGLLTSIVDQYNQSLTLTYTNTNFVSTVTDWKTRKLTFNYTGTPLRLTSVVDSTNRTINLGYSTAYNSAGDLVSVTDPLVFTNNTFIYDANHQIIATKDALGQLITTNIYDSFGRVTTQYSQGNTNKLFQVYWSGFDNAFVDPVGGKQEFFFDDKARQTATKDPLGNLNLVFYDGQDHVVTTVSPLNETNFFVYDANNNLIETVDPLSFSNVFVYDSSFNLVTNIDARGHPSTFGYNSKFQMTTSTNAAGDAVTNTYDSTTGVLATRSDAGGTTTYGYDGLGQLNSVITPSNLGTNLYLNNTLGDLVTTTNARGFVTAYQYNLRRQLTQTTRPTNLVTKIVYDPVGNVATNIDALSMNTVFTWSATRHLLTTTFPSTPQGSPFVTNTYDSRDWLVSTLDPLSHPSRYTNDLAQRLIAAVDPLLRTNTFAYDNDGHRTNATDGAMESAGQKFDARGQLTQTTDAATHTVGSGYDPNGNRIVLTNRNGKIWHLNVDAANRLTNTLTPLGKSNYIAYNHQGLLVTNVDFMNQLTTNGYDPLGRLTNRTDLVGITIYRYDFNGNLTNVIEGSKSNVNTFDAYDHLISYTDSASNVIKYGYDANGNLKTLTYPGNRTVTYTYDNLNRLTTVGDWSSRQTSYTYDLASRITSVTRPNGTVRSNYYDDAGELTNIIEQAATHAPIAFFKLNWNKAARVQYEFMAPTNLPYTLPSRTITYDDDNRMATFNGLTVVNDNNGNMTSGPLTNSSLVTYAYDARNRLTGVGGITYAYDPAGNRIAFTNGASVTTFVVDPKTSQVLMRIKGGVTNYYVYGLGLVYEEDDTSSTTNTLTYHFDYRGSTVALTDGSGNVTDRFQYSAYGLVTARGGTTDTPFQYNGKYGVQTDPNGLLYMRARYYNPYICRFINADPSGFGGGLNMYAYANGDPISLTDPFGLGANGDNLSSANLLSTATSLPGAVSPPALNFNISTTDFSQVGPIDLSNIPQAPAANTGPTAFIGPATDYLQKQDLTLGSNLDPASPFTSQMAVHNVLDIAGNVGGGVAGDVIGTTISALRGTTADATITVLGSGRDVAPYVGRAGFNTFTGEGIAAPYLDQQNALWLNQAIQRGDRIWLVTDPAVHQSFLNTLPLKPQSAYLNLELPMLNQYSGVNAIPKYLTGVGH